MFPPTKKLKIGRQAGLVKKAGPNQRQINYDKKTWRPTSTVFIIAS